MINVLIVMLWMAAGYWALHLLATWDRARKATWSLSAETHPAPPAEPPRVSICIPARNEEAVIGRCLRAVFAQDYPDFEVILVDDRSEDATAAEARAAAGEGKGLRIILGDGPPPGWMGKSAALWRAQEDAKGEWLCFVDADVVLSPEALRVALAAAQQHGADMLSWFGQLRTESFWEHVLMPFIGDLIVVSAPLKKVNDPDRDDCLANGQFLLIKRSAYDAIGGHEAIRESVIDDVSMGRAVKFHGHPDAEQRGARPGEPRLSYRLFHSVGLMNVRMYESLGGIWKGFAKNFYAGAKRQGGLLVAVLIYLLWMSVLPWLALPLLWALDLPGVDAAACAVFWTLVYRVYTRRFTPVPLPYVLLHPLAALVTAGILCDSMLRGLGILAPVSWKGRPVS